MPPKQVADDGRAHTLAVYQFRLASAPSEAQAATASWGALHKMDRHFSSVLKTCKTASDATFVHKYACTNCASA